MEIATAMKYTHIILAAALLQCCSPACTKDGPEHNTTTFILESSEGSQATATGTLDGNWQITGSPYWITASPTAGRQGENTITVTALSSNTEFREIEDELVLSVEGSPVIWHIIQRGADGIAPVSEEVNVPAGTSEFTITLKGNIPFEIASEDAWMQYVSSSEEEPELLSDGTTRSEYVLTRAVFKAEENLTGKVRTGHITLTSASGTQTITVSQAIPMFPDWNREFLKQNVFVKFTATWCPYCPSMAEALKKAEEAFPERIITMSCHSKTSQGGLAWDEIGPMEQYYGVTGMPSGYMNSIAEAPNYNSVGLTASIIEELARECTERYPAKTGIAARTSKDGDILRLEAFVACKEDLDYKISAFILEDGIVFPQQLPDNTSDKDYIHNATARKAISDVTGTPLEDAGEKGVSMYIAETVIHKTVKNPGNTYVLVYVSYPGNAPKGDVQNAVYGNYGWIIDNAVILPLEGEKDFEYELL